ncbi:MAG: RNA polymerase sigma factor [Cytophagales bacterium]|nr:RNA polymerase sigma factor [Cytophagales bacterium]
MKRALLRKSVNLNKTIKGCLRQEAKAQRDLYDYFSAMMLGVCSRYIHDRLEAEGVLVKGFMKVFQHLGQFEGKGELGAWIRRIMVNESLTYLRRNQKLYLETDVESLGNEEADLTAASYLEEEDLLQMIQRLPCGYRAVFNLYVIEGYSHAEIAELLQISAGTSKSQLSRARALLRKEILESEAILKQQRI